MEPENNRGCTLETEIKENDMNNSIYRFSLDLDSQDSQEYVTVRRGDTVKGLSVMLKESGTPYSITDDASAVLAAILSDGSYITEACTITEENRLEVVLPPELTADTGKHAACFILSEGNAALASPGFTICVEPRAAEDT